MGKVSTDNYQEALETGKEYLGKEFYRKLDKITAYKPRRCKECRTVLSTEFTGLYCSEWCKDIGSEKNYKLRKCKNYETCGNFTDVIYNKRDGRIAGHKRLCNECFDIKYNSVKIKIKSNKNYKKREYKYVISNNKCLQCGGNIYCREHNVNIKKFCEASCSIKYHYEKNKKNK